MPAKRFMANWRVVVLMLLVGVFPTIALSKDVEEKNEALAKGKQLFGRYCAGCHGPEGKGDGYKLLGPDPANLTSPSIKGKSDAALLHTIHEGKPNMPSWTVRLSDKDSRAVLAYVRTLAK